MADNAPPPMSEDEYYKRLMEEWATLLSSEESYDECAIQRFLEKHPCMIPGAFGLSFTSGHAPFPCAVISQPELKGFERKVADFMWLASDSDHLYPVFIEIETPRKKWFTSAGQQHHQLTHALGQIAEWKEWLDHPDHRSSFLRYYQIPDVMRQRTFHPIYMLIYGTRAEFEQNPHLNVLRARLNREHEHLMTFDRLSPCRDAMEYMCVRKNDEYSYTAVSVPPTFTFRPMYAWERSLIRGKKDAIRRMEWITEDRRRFLLERCDYWDAWSGKGVINAGDKE